MGTSPAGSQVGTGAVRVGVPSGGSSALRPNGARRGGSPYGPPRCISAQPFLQTSRPVGFRRASAENCRPAIFEARATLREQSGSTLGRRVYAPEVCPRLLGNGECPHYRQSFWLASLAPSAMAPSFRYTMSGTTAPNPANVLNPQSDPAMM